jgi:hypothetical protein
MILFFILVKFKLTRIIFLPIFRDMAKPRSMWTKGNPLTVWMDHRRVTITEVAAYMGVSNNLVHRWRDGTRMIHPEYYAAFLKLSAGHLTPEKLLMTYRKRLNRVRRRLRRGQEP